MCAALFAPSQALLRRPRTSLSPCAPRCVADNPHPRDVAVAPERKGERSNSKTFRVLGEGEPRPPPPPTHSGIALGGYLLEPMMGMGNSETRAKRYGGIYQSAFFVLKDQVFVNDYATIVACARDTKVFSARDVFYPSANLFGDDALFMLDGEEHSYVRSALAPAFSPSVFPVYMPAIIRQTRKLWDMAAKDSARYRFRNVELDPRFRDHYLAMSIEITTGLGSSDDMASRLRDRMNTAQTMMYGPPFGPLFERARNARKAILVDLEELIRRTLVDSAAEIERLRAYGDTLTSQGGRDVLAGNTTVLLVVLAQTQLSTARGADNDAAEVARIARILVVLWFAGYMTAAATTSCAVFEALRDETVLSALLAEQQTLGPEITYAQLNGEMPLLDSYVTEVLRMHPPISGVHRRPVVDVEILGHYVPAFTPIFFELKPSMYDDELYQDPHRLVPARFVRRSGVPPPPKILSFGAPGDVHHCIGAALGRVFVKATLAVWLREYDVKLDESQSKEYSYVPEDSPKDRVRVTTVRRRVK